MSAARTVAAMTEPMTVTVLDEQTKNELQPPCEARVRHGDTTPPAEWICTWRKTCECPRHRLYCDQCAEYVRRRGSGQWTCKACGVQSALVSLVKL